ncbi:uncharacterized protein J3R85_016171 [Psidium guajava]|nr:uncharacterized protein J3R85_016171 [Psidium guajava]
MFFFVIGCRSSLSHQSPWNQTPPGFLWFCCSSLGHVEEIICKASTTTSPSASDHWLPSGNPQA